ncbi:MAG: energy transducer TonB [Acidobacteriia bacterium]|nr:energy transducer TonB [Terriglobia bacterium]
MYPRLARLAKLQGKLTLVVEAASDGRIVGVRRISFDPPTTDRMVEILWEYVEVFLKEKWRLGLCHKSDQTAVSTATIPMEFSFKLTKLPEKQSDCEGPAHVVIECDTVLKVTCYGWSPRSIIN